MTEFRDYSTYLQKVVRLERRIHDLCNEKKFQQAKRLAMELQQVSMDLVTWLDDRVHADD